MHCSEPRGVELLARLVQRMQLSKVTIPAVDPSSFGPVDDTGVIIDAGETTTRTEEPSLMEVKVLSLVKASRFSSLQLLTVRTRTLHDAIS
jgi:hypothetical protein